MYMTSGSIFLSTLFFGVSKVCFLDDKLGDDIQVYISVRRCKVRKASCRDLICVHGTEQKVCVAKI